MQWKKLKIESIHPFFSFVFNLSIIERIDCKSTEKFERNITASSSKSETTHLKTFSIQPNAMNFTMKLGETNVDLGQERWEA